MEYLFEYLIFLAQAVTVVVAIIAVLSAIASLGARHQHRDTGFLEVHKLNDGLDALRDGLRRAMLDPSEFKKEARREAKATKKAAKARKKNPGHKNPGHKHPGHQETPENPSTDSQPTPPSTDTAEQQAQKSLADSEDDSAHAEAGEAGEAKESRVFVLDFKGDIQANGVKQLRTEITAVLTMAEQSDEVLVRLESPGGAVHGYGLAASQLDRIREQGVRLVVAVDKVAASGGYLMAAVADRVLAAPFAVIGSIGVVAQIPNVHRLLKKHDVDVEILTAGKYKRTLTVLGENTDEGRQKFVEELEEVHALFQEFVGSRRPALNLEEVATGEAWYGERALERNLVDQIITSDAYLTQACRNSDVYHVRWVEHKKPIERLLGHVEGSLTRLVEKVTGLW